MKTTLSDKSYIYMYIYMLTDHPNLIPGILFPPMLLLFPDTQRELGKHWDQIKRRRTFLFLFLLFYFTLLQHQRLSRMKWH